MVNKWIVFIFVSAGALVTESNLEAKISQQSQAHIKQRHWYKANSGPNTSHFNKSMTMNKLDAIANKTINQGSVRPSKHGQGRKTHQYKFNRPIGTDTKGKKAYSLRVVTDRNNNVITAFPVR